MPLHQKLPPGPSLTWLLTIDDRRAEINARADRLYEDAMRDLDEILAESALAATKTEHQETKG